MVHIQCDGSGRPYLSDCASALYGTLDLGLEYQLITYDELIAGKFDHLIKRSLFVGTVEFMTEVFKRVGIVRPNLPLNNIRPYTKIHLRDFIYQQPVFIKPTVTKYFTGFVVDEYSRRNLESFHSDCEVIIQDVINIRSEWRCYITGGKIADIRHYSGEIAEDLRVIPETFGGHIKPITLTNGFPDTYVMDVCFIDGTNCVDVVEFNDMWAIGNYGVPDYLYVRMLKRRYFEIIKNNI